jgi:hypothetical protein
VVWDDVAASMFAYGSHLEDTQRSIYFPNQQAARSAFPGTNALESREPEFNECVGLLSTYQPINFNFRNTFSQTCLLAHAFPCSRATDHTPYIAVTNPSSRYWNFRVDVVLPMRCSRKHLNRCRAEYPIALPYRNFILAERIAPASRAGTVDLPGVDRYRSKGPPARCMPSTGLRTSEPPGRSIETLRERPAI